MIARLLTLMLCLTLGLTSFSSGAARGGERAVDQLVICSGLQTSVIYLDANGTPTQSPHHCPDCALLGVDVAHTTGPHPWDASVFAHFVGVTAGQVGRGRVPEHALARAPPAPVI
ncbi:MAG: hypothetical protein AAF727_16175 [Pseudomonadota bacterium]